MKQKVSLINHHIGNLISEKGIKFDFQNEHHHIYNEPIDRIIYKIGNEQVREGREAINMAKRIIDMNRIPFTDGEYTYLFKEKEKQWYKIAMDIKKLVIEKDLYINIRDLYQLEELLRWFPDLEQIELTDENGNFIELIDLKSQ